MPTPDLFLVIRGLNIGDKWSTFNRVKFKVATALFTRSPFVILEDVFNSLNLSQTQDMLSSLRNIAQFGPNIICAMNHDYQILNSFDDLLVIKNSLILFHGQGLIDFFNLLNSERNPILDQSVMQNMFIE